MATKKVKKFGRGGDIVTGIGAALIGKALYDKYMGKDDSKATESSSRNRDEDSGASTKKPRISEEVEKAQGNKTEDRKEYVAADDEENKAKKAALAGGMRYTKPEASTAVDTSNNAAKDAAKAAKDAKAAKAAKDAKSQKNDDKKVSTDNAPAPTGSDSTRSSADDVIGAGIRNARIGEKNKPYPVNLPAVKEAERRQFLQNKAGLSGKGIPTPGDKNKTEATSKVAKAVQGTIDNRSKSMARTPEQKMSEGAREVQRRRDKEKAEKLGYGIKKGGMVKKYASGGSVSSASKRADGIAKRGLTRA